MMTRRSWLGAIIAGLTTSSCATVSGGPPLTLTLALESLPAIKTGAEFVERFGQPKARISFTHDDPNNEYPGWLIAPGHIRDQLWQNTQAWLN